MKSIQEHIDDGTYRKARHGDPDATPEGADLEEAPKPPSHLNRHGKAEWKRLLSGMIAMSLLKTVDLGLIEQACVFYGTFKELSIELSKKKDLFTFFNGKTSQNNIVMSTLNSCYKNYSEIVYKLGVSPIERSKIQVKKEPEKEKNPFAPSLVK